MPGNIKLVAEKWPHTLHLQDALAIVHDSQLILAHQFPATLSSGELETVKIDLPHKEKVLRNKLSILNVR